MDEIRRNTKLLFEALRSILFDDTPEPLDPCTLDLEFQDLGEGLAFLRRSVLEMRDYSLALAKGNLSVEPPPRENFLCQGLKGIHAGLNHLTWQAKQVAKGDYSQTVSYLGEFSEAFNAMTKQLSDREEKLREDARVQKEHIRTLEGYNQLLMELIHDSEETILVTSMEEPQILYPKGACLVSQELAQKCLTFRGTGEDQVRWEWNTTCSGGSDYRVITGVIAWQGQKAYAHILRDVTRQRQTERRLTEEAHQDTLTGIGNRLYFEEELQKLLSRPLPFAFCFCDLDHLKYVNDRFGHQEGDWYIRQFTKTVESGIRRGDIFARIGGDEFCLLLPGCSLAVAKRKIEAMQAAFAADSFRGYPKSFSCGILEVPGNHGDLTIRDIMEEADKTMYAQKESHKAVYSEQLR